MILKLVMLQLPNTLAFFTGGTASTNERMRINHLGNVAIGTSTWDGTNPEKFLVDAGTTTSVNAIVGKGSINSYLQLNIKTIQVRLPALML